MWLVRDEIKLLMTVGEVLVTALIEYLISYSVIFIYCKKFTDLNISTVIAVLALMILLPVNCHNT